MPPFRFIQLIEACSRKRSTKRFEDIKDRVRDLGYIDHSNRVTSKGQLVLAQYRDVRSRIERGAFDVMSSLILRGEESSRHPHCGMSLGYAKAKNWVANDEEGKLQITEEGYDMMAAQRAPMTWS